MITTGEFYKSKINEQGKYSSELKQKIEEAGEICIASLGENSYLPVMMLGLIQSGKTRSYIGLVALALDNDFDFILVLSKNSKALVNQTFKRLNREFSTFVQSKKLIVKDIFAINQEHELTAFEKKKKQIIVCKKQKHNLSRVEDYIKRNNFDRNKKILVIDDEADVTSIGFTKNKDEDDGSFTMQTIANMLNDIRGNLANCVFLQVTATPYALYLQPRFDNEEILPLRPDKTIVIPSGNGYVGGKEFFIDNDKKYYKRIYDKELDFVTNNILDRRSITPDKLIGSKTISRLVESIFTFIIGGCVLRLKGEITELDSLSSVIHTNTQKNKHTNAEQIVKRLIEQLNKTNRATQKVEIEEKITVSYNELSKTVNSMPALADVKTEFLKSIDEEMIKTIVVNSDNDVATYLNEDGEIDLTTPYTIIIGGQTLDRGITISNMIGFYYGRNPKTTQQDTVMQHMRLFGYRKPNQLSVTRFYTSRLIFERLKKTIEIDEELRENIISGNQREGLYLLKHDSGTIKPCARNKIAVSDIVYVKGKQRVLPVGFSTRPKSYTVQQLKKITQSIETLKLDDNGTCILDIKAAKDLLTDVYSLFIKDEDTARFIELQTLFNIIDALKIKERHSDKIGLIIRRNRNISKYKESDSFQDAPDTKTELPLAYSMAEINPVLLLIEQNGLEDNGWNGSKFWWPVLITPVNSDRMMMALDDARVNVRKRKETK